MSNSTEQTYFWFDFETTGTDPIRDRPMQFAGMRTDMNFNPIGEPVMLYCKLADDVLPHPKACLLTGISPQQANRDGLCEAEFMGEVQKHLGAPNTIALGYNTLRFDDEIVRHGFYRNFIDPYAREWQNGCSRWDVIDLVRMCFAMRPDGIVWPKREDGTYSLKLEDLSVANGLAHEQAHDALSDVYATIGLAKLIRDKQPKLFDYYLSMKDKSALQSFIDPLRMKPFLHISGMFGQEKKFAAFVAPVAHHPSNKNAVVVVDLMGEIAPLQEWTVDEIRQNLFSTKEQLGSQLRLPVKLIHLNKCPAVAPATFLKDPTVVQRLQLDGEVCRQNLALLRQADGIAAKLVQVHEREFNDIPKDPDQMLYSGGFFSNEDRRRMEEIRATPGYLLGEMEFSFDDRRLDEMLTRYIARNYPEGLTSERREQWEEFRSTRLLERDGGGTLTMSEYFAMLNEIAIGGELTAAQQHMLQDLADYAQSIYPY
ncbi:exodeoxyribonuclease I [Maribrevibacterium harenarium]|uniref:Exodeoxyribonuclease I n=1 Tax=Maribrevibacterium harenarium TaxID=2589817 RepID=A0A501WZ57_9GAMM|nr:exodeoxyribonuclease I [Maribrevibacterium harenarium]TPE52321.1 exodeoxyribonuclease I [Maribrevibacterium harenarium]